MFDASPSPCDAYMGLLTHWRGVRVNRPRVVVSVVSVVPVVPVGAHGHGQPQVQVELLKEVGKTRPPLVVSRRTCSAAVLLAPLALAPQPYLLGSGEAHPGHEARLLPLRLRVPHGGQRTLAKPFSTV